MPSCEACGAALPEGARFCPECGTRVEARSEAVPPAEAVPPPGAVPPAELVPPSEPEPGDTAVDAPPPEEEGTVPVTYAEQPRFFGITPATSVFAVAVAAVAVAILLFALSHWLIGLVFLALAAALFALFISVAERRPDEPVARASVDALGGAKARVGAAVEAVGALTSARRELLRLRREREELRSRRERLLQDFGRAVYGGDDEEAAAARRGLTEVDDLMAAKETEMATITERMQQRLHAARNEVQGTQLLEPPAPVPEPFPPPDEGTLPTPPPVPEPYPPPDEGTPPQPDPTPEAPPGEAGRRG